MRTVTTSPPLVWTVDEPPASCGGAIGTLASGGGEFCMFGMSDDEDEVATDDDDEQIERNVVASTIQQGGGAFAATSGCALSLERLGLVGLDLEPEPLPRPPRQSTGSEAPSCSSPLLSPLIAGLNPFLSPLRLDLPPPGLAPGQVAAGDADEAPGCFLGPAASDSMIAANAGSGEAGVDVHHLLVEMGDLVCKLQQRQPLAITSLEVSPEELLSRLAHFRQLGGGGEPRRRP